MSSELAIISHQCMICSQAASLAGFRFDDRYGYQGRFKLWKCGSCGHLMLEAHMTSEEIADLYTEYYPRSNFDVSAWVPPATQTRLVTWWRGSLASAFRWVPPNVRVLDVGCGFGESLGYHRSR